MAKGSAYSHNSLYGAADEGYTQVVDILEYTTLDKVCITTQATVRWRKRQQGQVARKQYIDLVGAQEQWGKEKLPEHESNKSHLHEPVSIRPSLLRSASYKVSLPEPAKDDPELCEPAECRPAHGSLKWIACGKRLLRIESKEGANDISVEPEMDAETTMDGVNAAEQTTATVNLVERIEDAHMHKRRRTNPTPDHVPSTNVWHHRPTQTEAPKLAPRRPPAKRRTHKRTRKAAKQDSDAIKQVNKRPAESETVSSESCKTKQDASVSASPTTVHFATDALLLDSMSRSWGCQIL